LSNISSSSPTLSDGAKICVDGVLEAPDLFVVFVPGVGCLIPRVRTDILKTILEMIKI